MLIQDKILILGRNQLLILVSVFLLSCSKIENEGAQLIVDVGFDFSIVDSLNRDLLDSTTYNHILISKVKLYYLIGDKIEEVYDPLMDYPRNYLLYRTDSETRIRIFMNNAEKEYRPTTFIKWDENDLDTIEAIYERNSNSVIKRTVWLNGKEIWDSENSSEGYYKIRKNYR